MIPANRFIARSSDTDLWLSAREKGVSATAVAKAATPAGFKEAVANWGVQIESNPYMDWGVKREPVIALAVKERFDIMPNDWLIQSEEYDWALATPDGLSLTHQMIAEIKTGGKPFSGIPIAHRRQIQWQLFVTGALSCVYAYEQRINGKDGFIPDFDIHFEVVERDDKMITDLIETAKKLQEALRG